MSDTMRRAIGERLRRARVAFGLHQQDVAEEFKCSRQAISSWESGKTLPTLLQFQQMTEFYGVSPDSLLLGLAVEDSCMQALTAARERRSDFAPSGLE
jgi:transcriptional regulator with XRE-family HTH domain